MKIKIFKSLTLVAAGIISVLPSVVSAHGYPNFPQARQGFCLDQGGYWHPADGSAIPNAACRAAFLESGHYPFTQAPEFAALVPDFHNQAAVEIAVPDGTLCAGGDANKSGMNIPSADWQRTEITPDANGNIQLVFKAHTPHNPSFWKIYLTKPGFNVATDSPNWSDLELIQEHQDLSLSQVDGHSAYQMDVAIPTGRDGDAILFTRWQRDDVVGEGFYSCSDITIEGTGTYEPVWSSAGFYLKQGQTANIGDTIRARLFSATGQELINEVVTIDAQNLSNWQESLANTLVTENSQLIEVGVEDAQGDIVFNGADLAVNQVWVQDTNHTFNLTVAPPTPNTAPSVDAISDVSVAEGGSVSINVNATDADGDALTYQWTVGADVNVSGSGASVTLTAGQVSADTNNQVSVTVSDGTLSTTQSFTVTVTDVAHPPVVTITNPASGVEYTVGDSATFSVDASDQDGSVVDVVFNLNGTNVATDATSPYSHNWTATATGAQTLTVTATDDSGLTTSESVTFTVNAEPVCTVAAWSASSEYFAGAQVSKDGVVYNAKWWSKGEDPATSGPWGAWAVVGPCE